MFDDMMKKLKKEFGFLSEDETSDNSGVEDNVLKQLDRSEKLDDIDTVTFGLETDDGKIVKVYVQADQAEDFEKALSAKLGEVDDIEECLNELSKEFEIVDVEWPDEEGDDEEAEEGEEGEEDGEPETDGSEVLNNKVYKNKEEKATKTYQPKLEDLDLGERVSLSLTEGDSGGSVEERLTTATQLLVYHALLELGLPEIALNKSPYKASIIHGIKHRAAEMTKDTQLKTALKIFVAKATHSKPDPDAVEVDDDDQKNDDDGEKKEEPKKDDESPKKKHHKKPKDEPKEEPSKEEPSKEEPSKESPVDEPVEPPKEDDEDEELVKKKKKKPKFMESLMIVNEGLYQDYWDGVNQLLAYISASPKLLEQLQESTQYKALVNRSQLGITQNVKSGVRAKLAKLAHALKAVNPTTPTTSTVAEGVTPDNLSSLVEDLFNMADPTPNKSLAVALIDSSIYKSFINRAKPKLTLKFNGSMHQLLIQLMDVVGQTMTAQKPVNKEPAPVQSNAPMNATQESLIPGKHLTESTEWTFTKGDDDNAIISCEQLKFTLDQESLEKAVKSLEGHTVVVLKDATDPSLKITISPRGINAVIKKAGDHEVYPMNSEQIKEFTEFAINGSDDKSKEDDKSKNEKGDKKKDGEEE